MITKPVLYDKSKISWNNLMFSREDLKKLLIPLMVQQVLTCFMGMADTMMVSRIGGAAISAVSLVDSINILVIQMLSALAAGGTILCSQYIGKRDLKNANKSARQVIVTVLMISVPIMIICLTLRSPLLHLIFGQVDAAVMEAAVIYFFYTSISFPFLALFEAGAAFFRAGGNSRFPMKVSVISNFLNIGGNAFFIFVLHLGVAGAAVSTLLSRIFCAVVVFYYLRKPKQEIVIDQYAKIRPDFRLIRNVLAIGIPSGVENGMFQFGKLAIQSSVSTLGTIAIAANAMTAIFEMLNGICGIAIGIGLMTVVGQCVGAGKIEEAKYYIVQLTLFAEVMIALSCLITYLIAGPVTVLAGMEAESARMCMQMTLYVSLVKPLVWFLAFVPAYGMRAAGDVKFSMTCTSLTMWFCRVALTTVLIRVIGWGPIAVWVGMSADWLCRAIIFTWRYFTGKWYKHYLV